MKNCKTNKIITRQTFIVLTSLKGGGGIKKELKFNSLNLKKDCLALKPEYTAVPKAKTENHCIRGQRFFFFLSQ